MCNEIVAVVNDGIIVTGNIVAVFVANLEVSHLTQVAVGRGGKINQITTHLTQEDGAVSNNLQLVQDANHGENRVNRIVQMLLIGIEHIVGLLFEEFITRSHKPHA